MSNPYETWWKWLTHDVINFTKFHEDWTKIVDFLLRVNFWMCPGFFAQTLLKSIFVYCVDNTQLVTSVTTEIGYGKKICTAQPQSCIKYLHLQSFKASQHCSIGFQHCSKAWLTLFLKQHFLIFFFSFVLQVSSDTGTS